MHYRSWPALLVICVLTTTLNGFAQETPTGDKTQAGEGARRRVAQSTASEKKDADGSTDQAQSKEEKDGWKMLLPAKGLDGWEVTDFGGQGEVHWDGKTLLLEKGELLTGINYLKEDFPTSGYEIQLQAKRIEGNDFLCGLTFPVGKEFCSLIAGGWGGGLIGLSSIDGFDASENATSTFHQFKNGEWYTFRLAVDDNTIHAWIDDKKFVEFEREGHKLSTRIEVYICEPLGFCAFQSKVAVRDFKWRPLKAAEATPGESKAAPDANSEK